MAVKRWISFAVNKWYIHGRKLTDRLCFEGGVSVQTTLPFGTVEDVRREVAELITVSSRGGGYILGPAHAIQAGTPPENIVAMFDTALSHYPFQEPVAPRGAFYQSLHIA